MEATIKKELKDLETKWKALSTELKLVKAENIRLRKELKEERFVPKPKSSAKPKPKVRKKP